MQRWFWKVPVIARLFCAALVLAGLVGLTGTGAIAADLFAAKTSSCGVSYFLPKKLLHVRVTERSGQRSVSVDAGLTVADPSARFCFGLLGSPAAPDLVVAVIDQRGLLQELSLSDQPSPSGTGGLAPSLAASLAGRGNVGAGDVEHVVLDFVFDPLDAKGAAAANRTLRASGFCVFIEGHSFPAGVAPSSWCQNPRPYPTQERALAAAAGASPPPLALSGRSVFYRPNITYNLVVMRKAGPRSSAPWVVDREQQVDLPNVSPPIAVDIDPPLLAKRSIHLEFADGVLTGVSVGRPAEGTVEIPLRAAQGIVSIPNRVVTIGNDLDQNRDALIRAQTQLIQSLTDNQLGQRRAQPKP